MQFLVLGIILILAMAAIRISSKHGIPALLLFIVLGMGFGLLGLDFNDYAFADGIATVALMIIMFYGGFGTSWKMTKPVAKEAIVLASLGVVTTALLTGFFCHYILGFSFMEGMLIGSIVGSTDYASVSNILRSKNLNLKYNTAPLLELESGSNDPTAYTMTMVFLSVMMGSELSVPLLILTQVAIGLAIGFIYAFFLEKLLRFRPVREDGLTSVFLAAVILITYASASIIGGNGYLALYILGIRLGNMEFRGKREATFFFDGFSQMMNIALFFVLGLLSNFNDFLKTFPVALAIMVFMTIVARPASVWGLMLPFKLKKNQLHMISLTGIRGAAAIAFAILTVNSDVELSSDIYHIVFGICVLSSLIQGSLMPPAARKLDMLDPSDTVMQTFNYYQDKAEIGFLETHISPESHLVGTQVKDLNLTFDFIVAKIVRDGKPINPRGHVVVKENDIIVLAGAQYFDQDGQDLVEFTIPKGHKWINQQIKDLSLSTDRLIVMVQRDGKPLVPSGNTKLLQGDKILLQEIHEPDEKA